ncbi:MAG: phosphopantothenoylcysteine decarboxylase [Verrucomicrobiaceae bacterium]|nr:phosphopantothenoylcysteine decarboxylase [Verrucomicrobiaceae bacterium]
MRFLITAVPTREPIDPVRYLSNRSSGKMGYALAEAALADGHAVTLVSGPVAISPPPEASLVSVETAREMYDAVAAHLPGVDVAIFCAAVADYRVASVAGEKIKKAEEELDLRLVKNPDILGSARTVFGFGGLLVGFAAETHDLARHALDKLRRKQCDLLVANDVSRREIGFDRDDNEVTLFFPDGTREELPRASKRSLADLLIARIVALPKQETQEMGRQDGPPAA